MNIGPWIRQKRAELGLDQKTLAQQARLDASTLSRLEHEKTALTVGSGICIAQALEINLSALYKVMADQPDFEIPAPLRETMSPCLTRHDVFRWEQFCHQNQAVARTFFCRWLNQIQQLEDKELTSVQMMAALKPEDIDKLLARSRLYAMELKYPAFIKPETILEIYRQGGVLLREDAFIFVRAELIRLKISLARNENAFPVSILTQLRYADSARKIKLGDLIRLDDRCGAQGDLVGLCLKAMEFDMVVVTSPAKPIIFINRPSDWQNIDRFQWGHLLVLTSRWVECRRRGDNFLPDWLAEVRALMSGEQVVA